MWISHEAIHQALYGQGRGAINVSWLPAWAPVVHCESRCRVLGNVPPGMCRVSAPTVAAFVGVLGVLVRLVDEIVGAGPRAVV